MTATAAERSREFFRSQASRLAGGGPMTLEREEALLRAWGEMAKYGIKRSSGRAQVKGLLHAASGDLQAAAFDLVDAVAPHVATAFADRFIPFAERVIEKWPVKSGASKRLLNVQMSSTREAMTATLSSPAAYTFLMKWGKRKTPPGFRTGASVWWSLVRTPHRTIAQEMAADIERAVK